MDHAGRLSRLRSGLEENDLDSLLIAHLPNVHYLCGFTGSAAALLVADGGSILFTDGRYGAQAKEEVNRANVDHVSIVIARKSPLVAAAEWLAAQRRSSTSIFHANISGHRTGVDHRRHARPVSLCAEREGAPAFGATAGRARPHGEGRCRNPAHPAGGGTRRQSFPDCTQENSAGCN